MRKILLALTLVLIILVGYGVFLRRKALAPVVVETKTSPSTSDATSSPPASFDKTKYSTDTPGSLWWVVNKNRALPDGYVPPDLVVPNVALRLGASSDQMHISNQQAAAMQDLFAGAAKVGYKFMLLSGYRSQAYQQQLFNSYVKTEGQAAAEASSAKPGHSEHQTGLSADVGRADHKCELNQCFADTAEGRWLTDHAYEYGYIIRYQQGKDKITGYMYEPWHIRFVGKDLAAELHKTGQTIEEFFEL